MVSSVGDIASPGSTSQAGKTSTRPPATQGPSAAAKASASRLRGSMTSSGDTRSARPATVAGRATSGRPASPSDAIASRTSERSHSFRRSESSPGMRERKPDPVSIGLLSMLPGASWLSRAGVPVSPALAGRRVLT